MSRTADCYNPDFSAAPTTDLEKWVCERATYYWLLACEKFKVYLSDMPTICWFKSAANAGKAWLYKNKVGYNKPLLEHMAHREDFDSTIGHEIAHIFAARQFQSTGHDYRWRGVMVVLGLDPTRFSEDSHRTALHAAINAGVLRKRKSGRELRCPKCGHVHHVKTATYRRIEQYRTHTTLSCQQCQFEANGTVWIPNVSASPIRVQVTRVGHF